MPVVSDTLKDEGGHPLAPAMGCAPWNPPGAVHDVKRQHLAMTQNEMASTVQEHLPPSLKVAAQPVNSRR